MQKIKIGNDLTFCRAHHAVYIWSYSLLFFISRYDNTRGAIQKWNGAKYLIKNAVNMLYLNVHNLH